MAVIGFCPICRVTHERDRQRGRKTTRNLGGKVDLIIGEEELKPWTPVMVRRHFRVKAKHLRTHADHTCRMIYMTEVLSQDWKHELLIESPGQIEALNRTGPIHGLHPL